MTDNEMYADVQQKKSALRSLFIKLRDSLSPHDRQTEDEKLVRAISESELFSKSENLLLYYPVRSEINILPLAELALENGKAVFFPVCDKKTHNMVFYRVFSLDSFCTGEYNIPEPCEKSFAYSKELKNTLCILPGLAADKSGHRLGYGGGYYDRFLSAFEGITVFPVRERFIYKGSLPKEKTDRPCMYIATQKGVHKAENELH